MVLCCVVLCWGGVYISIIRTSLHDLAKHSIRLALKIRRLILKLSIMLDIAVLFVEESHLEGVRVQNKINVSKLLRFRRSR